MSASRARRIAVAFVVSLNLILGVVPAASAADAAPNSMAAVGDSITQAASSAGSLGTDAPQNSWSTGTSTTVNSHFLRLRALNPSITAFNRSVSGAKMANLNAQMSNVVALSPDPGFLTVLMGGNDLCTDTVAQMTSVPDFRAQFAAAMATLTNGSPGTKVYVVSLPNVYQLWNLFKSNHWARFIWATAGICQSMLANPTSTQAADVQRRDAVLQRNIDYNTQLAQVCAAFTNCHFDGNAVFNTVFATSDVSGDYFHPSVAGQRKLAQVSWDAGFAWVPQAPENQPPSASFTPSCSHLACSFTNTSTDDGTMTHAWAFGDAGSSTEMSPSYTYATAGTFDVTLTVTDDGGATDVATATVTTSLPPQNVPPTASFSASCTGLTCTFTNLSSDDGTMSHAWSFDDGLGSTETSPVHTYATAGAYDVTLTVTDDDGATSVDAEAVVVTAPPTEAVTVRVADLTGTPSIVNKSTWRASVTILVTDTAGAPIANAAVSGTWTAGAPDSCSTGASGTCTVLSDNLSRKSVGSVTFSVGGVSHATLAYDATKNAETSTVIIRP